MKTTSRTSSTDTEKFDVAIVGAGIAGLFVASEVAREWPEARLCVFDAAEEAGGRIASLVIPGVPLVAEIGAMRYLPSHTKLTKLVSDLGLKPRRFGFDETDFFYLRGYCLPGTTFAKARQWSGRTPLPFRVAKDEHRTPFDLIELSVRKALSRLTLDQPPANLAATAKSLRGQLNGLSRSTEAIRFSRDKWDLIKRYGMLDGKLLCDIGFLDLVYRGLDPEAYQLAYEGCGYESILTMWNAADAIPWFLADFSTSGYQTIEGGMQKLTDVLFENLTRAKGQSVARFQHVLESLETDGGEGIRLRFGQGVDPYEVRANAVVLALPQRALAQLQLRGLRLQTPDWENDRDDDAMATARFRYVTNSVTPNALLKLFLLYDERWWSDASASDPQDSFRVVTDQPLRQIYHFGADHEVPQPKAKTGNTSYGFVLAYSDSRAAEYWKILNETDDEKYVRRGFRASLDVRGKQTLDRLLIRYGVAPGVVERAQSQLARVHGRETDLPKPCVAFLRHWMDPPYHAGWHAWNVGSFSPEIADFMLKPFRNGHVYICGEAFSNDQGWIEGALETAGKVLDHMKTDRRELGLTRRRVSGPC